MLALTKHNFGAKLKENCHLSRQVVAVLLPALNEEVAIAATIESFRAVLPAAVICVCDNGSTDQTVAVAKGAGAIVLSEPERGKGNAMRRMFSGVDADIYVMCDADLTYDAAALPRMIEMLTTNDLDMVIGARASTESACYRAGHKIGNKFFCWLFSRLFSCNVVDLFSGFRVLSRRYVKSVLLTSSGFEVEAELSAAAVINGLPFAETPVGYFSRPEGSKSKLRTYRDGWLILMAILKFRLFSPRQLAFQP